MIQSIVQIAAIHRDDGAWRKRQPLRHADIVDVAFGDERPTGQTALVIQLEMELDGSLGPYEPSPIEHRGTQLDDRRIQGPQRMFEPEPRRFKAATARHRVSTW